MSSPAHLTAVSAEAPPALVADAFIEISRLHERCNCEPAAGLSEVESALSALETRTFPAEWTPLVAAALDNAATAAEYRLGRLDAALSRARRNSEGLRTNTLLTTTVSWTTENRRLLATSVRISAVILDAQGDHANALRHHHEVIALYRALDDRLNLAKAWHNLSILFARTMLFSEAVDAMRQSALLQTGFSDPGRFREFMTWTHQANVYLEMGDAPAAESAARRAIETTADQGAALGRGEPHAALGAALLAQSRIPESIQAFDEARRRLEATGNRVGLAEVISGLARAQAVHDLSRGRKLMEEAVVLARESGAQTDAARFQCWIARTFVDENKPARALDLARASLDVFRAGSGLDPAELDARLIIADALALEGSTAAALAAHRDYHQRFATAHDARKTLHAHLLAVQYQVELAQRDAAHARLESARLSEALAEIAARLNSEKSGRPARTVTEVTAESLRPLGLRPRECEVLLWVVRGKSNDEIGTILGCSSETVKSHLKRIYTRLDVTNRASATARAMET